MATRVQYKGYVLVAAPSRTAGGRWVAKVIIEQHHGGSVHFQPVSDAPEKTYPTREEAEEASIRFGQGLLDSRIE
mgnify:CR=1 FL=1|jgi:hypothetical protein